MCVCVCVCVCVSALPSVDSLNFEASPVRPKSPAAARSAVDSLGALPYVPHDLYAGHSDPPQLLPLSDIQAEVQRCLGMVAQPATAQAKQFPYFLIESASGSGKTRFAFELLQWLRLQRAAAAAEARSAAATTMQTDAAAAVSAAAPAALHLFPHAVVCSTPLQELVSSAGANDAAAGLRLLLQLLYQRGGRIVPWQSIMLLSQSEVELRVAELLRRWGRIRGDPEGGARAWLLLLDEAQLAPRAVSAMLRAIFAWNFPPAAASPFSHSIGIIPIVVGTSAAEICTPDIIRATGYAPWKAGPLSLPFLAPTKAAQLLSHVLQAVDVQESKFIRHLASEFSGWPIAFSFLYTALGQHRGSAAAPPAATATLTKNESTATLTKNECQQIYDQIVENLAATYSAEKLAGMAPEYVKQVIRMAVTGWEV